MIVSGLIASFATGTYTVTRRAAASYTAGRAVAGATSTLSIVASVQPAAGRDLLRLEEGRRSIETRVLYTTTALLVGSQAGANDADLVAIDGASWEVQTVESWPAADGYSKAIVQRSA